MVERAIIAETSTPGGSKDTPKLRYLQRQVPSTGRRGVRCDDLYYCALANCKILMLLFRVCRAQAFREHFCGPCDFTRRGVFGKFIRNL
jgi:hypothetical protein